MWISSNDCPSSKEIKSLDQFSHHECSSIAHSLPIKGFRCNNVVNNSQSLTQPTIPCCQTYSEEMQSDWASLSDESFIGEIVIVYDDYEVSCDEDNEDSFIGVVIVQCSDVSCVNKNDDELRCGSKTIDDSNENLTDDIICDTSCNIEHDESCIGIIVVEYDDKCAGVKSITSHARYRFDAGDAITRNDIDESDRLQVPTLPSSDVTSSERDDLFQDDDSFVSAASMISVSSSILRFDMNCDVLVERQSQV